MKIYLDSDYKCHLVDDGTMTAIETDFFDGKCQRFIEGYRFVPANETWKRDDGEVFTGEMVSPYRDYEILAELQEQYEETQTEIADMKAALDAIYAGVTE